MRSCWNDLLQNTKVFESEHFSYWDEVSHLWYNGKRRAWEINKMEWNQKKKKTAENCKDIQNWRDAVTDTLA